MRLLINPHVTVAIDRMAERPRVAVVLERVRLTRVVLTTACGHGHCQSAAPRLDRGTLRRVLCPLHAGALRHVLFDGALELGMQRLRDLGRDRAQRPRKVVEFVEINDNAHCGRSLLMSSTNWTSANVSRVVIASQSCGLMCR